MIPKLFALWLSILVVTYAHTQEPVVPEKVDLVLPTPSGKYSVGRYWTNFTDSSRSLHEISLFLYYPVMGNKVVDFIIPTEQWRSQYLPVLQKKLGEAAGEAVSNAKAVFSDQTSMTGKEKFPLLLFSPGMGWSTLEYSFIIHELVSAGYIVAAINSSATSPVLQTPEGRFIAEQSTTDRYQQTAEDIVYVLQQLKTNGKQLNGITESIDFTKVAALGHSLGGAAAILAAHTSGDIKTAVNMDGDLMEASSKASPRAAVLFLNQLPAGFETRSFTDMKKDSARGWRYQQMSNAASEAFHGTFIAVAGMYHSNFQDYALLPKSLIPENIRNWRLGPIDGIKCLGQIKQTLITYLDQELKGKKSDWQKLQKEQSNIRVINIKP